jgi:hypothetical protein
MNTRLWVAGPGTLPTIGNRRENAADDVRMATEADREPYRRPWRLGRSGYGRFKRACSRFQRAYLRFQRACWHFQRACWRFQRACWHFQRACWRYSSRLSAYQLRLTAYQW